jgi:hypothetical protein
MNKAITLTFGDQAENHKGMEKYGEMAKEGLSYEDMCTIRQWFESNGALTYFIDLHYLLPETERIGNEAWFLIIKNGVNTLLHDENCTNALVEEQESLVLDTKAYMYGRVVNKNARHNLCFSSEHLEPDYEKGRGRVYAFEEVPVLNTIREKLGQIGCDKIANLQIEGNYYYDTNKCGIGWHGDSERKIVVGLRLGAKIPLCYRWYQRSKPASDPLEIYDLENGDLYFMSEKAVGTDWKKKIIYTLRHSAGCEKFIGTE